MSWIANPQRDQFRAFGPPTMRRLLSLAGMLIAAGLASAADPDPKAILDAADQAAKRVQSVLYEAETQASGALRDVLPRLKGRVLLMRGPSDAAPRVRVDVDVSAAANPTDARKLQVACDGQAVTIVDHGRKAYGRETLPRGQALLNPVAAIVLREFVAGAPFADEIKAKSLRYERTEDVGGVACDVLFVEYVDDNASTALWYFGKEDHLPRRVDRTMNSANGPTTMSLLLAGLQLNPKLDPDALQLVRPAGYVDASTGPSSNPASRPANPPQNRERPALLENGSEAPNWTLQTPDGTAVSLKDLRGKVVVLDFWATWCGWCIKGMPEIEKLHQRFKDKPVAVFGVNCRERDPQKPRDFLAKQALTYGQLLQGDAVANAYKVAGLPVVYVIGADGRILFSQIGFAPNLGETLAQTIEKALAAQP